MLGWPFDYRLPQVIFKLYEMRKINYLNLIGLLLLLASLGCNRMLYSELPIVEMDGVKYELVKASDSPSISNGGSVRYIPKDPETGEDGRVYIIDLFLTNTSNRRLVLDLTDISLCNEDGICLTSPMVYYKAFADGQTVEILSLDPKKKKGRRLVFSGPKGFVPKYVALNDEADAYLIFDYKE